MSFFLKAVRAPNGGRTIEQERTQAHTHYSFDGDRGNKKTFTMSADQLLMQMLSWIEQREGSARQLQKLADKLPRKSSNTWLQSDTMKEAKKIESKGLEIKQNIQKLFSRLRAEGSQAASSDDPDDLDRHILSEISGAMARKNGLEHHFNKEMFQNPYFSSGATSDKSLGDDFFITHLTVQLAGFLSFFTLEASGSELQFLFDKGAQQLFKEISTTGLETVLKRDPMAIGGVIGLAFELPEAINHWRDLIKKNNATEARRSLRDTANALLQINDALKKQLDKIKQMLVDSDKLITCMTNPDRSAQQIAEFIEIVRRNQNQTIWNLLSQDENREIFFKFVDIFYFLRKEMDGKRWNINQMIIDIIFVAHGRIEDPLIPASDLLPRSMIEDVILYSPWNCVVDAKVVYGIATGSLQTQHRVFCCKYRCHCSNPLPHQVIGPLPPDWNSMRNAGGSGIASILVSPLKHPHDPAWNRVLFLEQGLGGPGRNRVVIPYIIPEYRGEDKYTIPFCLVTLALSQIASFFPFRARVHLGACLERALNTTLTNHLGNLAQQYATTRDSTMMTSSDTVVNQYLSLFNALRAEFD